MDYSREFKINAQGEHFLDYYGWEVPVPAPAKALGEMNREEYSAYYRSVLPVLYNHPDYPAHWQDVHRGERFTM